MRKTPSAASNFGEWLVVLVLVVQDSNSFVRFLLPNTKTNSHPGSILLIEHILSKMESVTKDFVPI